MLRWFFSRFQFPASGHWGYVIQAATDPLVAMKAHAKNRSQAQIHRGYEGQPVPVENVQMGWWN